MLRPLLSIWNGHNRKEIIQRPQSKCKLPAHSMSPCAYYAPRRGCFSHRHGYALTKCLRYRDMSDNSMPLFLSFAQSMDHWFSKIRTLRSYWSTASMVDDVRFSLRGSVSCGISHRANLWESFTRRRSTLYSLLNLCSGNST